jgi:hypothetical protein
VGVLTDDSFTQTNPPVITAANTITTQVDQTENGVLSGSVAYTRPQGSNWIGGPASLAVLTAMRAATNPVHTLGFRALGCFINSANGNAFENTPGVASGKGPYVSAQGCYGNALFETQLLDGDAVAGMATGDPLVYSTGVGLMGSLNGYLMPTEQAPAAAVVALDVSGGPGDENSAESYVREAAASATFIGVCKMPPDAVQNELVYDQRI